MNKNSNDRERRQQAAFEKLGTTEPRCGTCGYNDWRALERHHVGQGRFDETCVIVCRNCHRRLSDDQRDHPPPLPTDAPNLFEQVGHFLLGLADLFRILVEKLIEFGLLLIAHAPTEQRKEPKP